MNVATTDKFCNQQPKGEASIVSQVIPTSREAAEILSQKPTLQITNKLPNPNSNSKFKHCIQTSLFWRKPHTIWVFLSEVMTYGYKKATSFYYP